MGSRRAEGLEAVSTNSGGERECDRQAATVVKDRIDAVAPSPHRRWHQGVTPPAIDGARRLSRPPRHHAITSGIKCDAAPPPDVPEGGSAVRAGSAHQKNQKYARRASVHACKTLMSIAAILTELWAN